MRAWCRKVVSTIGKRLGLDVPGHKAGTGPYLMLTMTSWWGLALGGESYALLFGSAAKQRGGYLVRYQTLGSGLQASYLTAIWSVSSISAPHFSHVDACKRMVLPGRYETHPHPQEIGAIHYPCRPKDVNWLEGTSYGEAIIWSLISMNSTRVLGTV